MVAPRVRLMEDVAVVAYVRLVQRTVADGAAQTLMYEETRVWQRRESRWRHVHFHRSIPT
jgi:calcium/calmodulin-dependent protein kinase (CaM kinase) II